MKNISILAAAILAATLGGCGESKTPADSKKTTPIADATGETTTKKSDDTSDDATDSADASTADDDSDDDDDDDE